MYSPIHAAVSFSRVVKEGLPHQPTNPLEKAAIAAHHSLELVSIRQACLTFSPAGWFLKINFLDGNKEAEDIARAALMERAKCMDWSMEIDDLECLDLQSYRTIALPPRFDMRPSSTLGLFAEPIALIMKDDWFAAIPLDPLMGCSRQIS